MAFAVQGTLHSFFKPKPAAEPAPVASSVTPPPACSSLKEVASDERSAAPTEPKKRAAPAARPTSASAPTEPPAKKKRAPAAPKPKPVDGAALASLEAGNVDVGAAAKPQAKKRAPATPKPASAPEACAAADGGADVRVDASAEPPAKKKRAPSAAKSKLDDAAFTPAAVAAAVAAWTEQRSGAAAPAHSVATTCADEPTPLDEATAEPLAREAEAGAAAVAEPAAAAKPAAKPAANPKPAAKLKAAAKRAAARRRALPLNPPVRRPPPDSSDDEASAASSESSDAEDAAGSEDDSDAAAPSDASDSDADSEYGKPRRPRKQALAPRAPRGAGGAGGALSEYERQRLENIAKNNAMLRELGLLNAPPLAAPKQRMAPSGFAAMRLPRRKADQAEPAKRSSRLRGEAPEPLDLDKLPKVVRTEREPRAASESHELSADALAALAAAAGESWFVRFTEWMFAHHSAPNARNVCGQLHKLIAGLGVQHKSQPSHWFMVGEPLRLHVDVPALKLRAREWFKTVGPDTSGGWLVSHPLSKLWLFQQQLATEAHEAGEDARDGGAEATDAAPEPAPADADAAAEAGAARERASPPRLAEPEAEAAEAAMGAHVAVDTSVAASVVDGDTVPSAEPDAAAPPEPEPGSGDALDAANSTGCAESV